MNRKPTGTLYPVIPPISDSETIINEIKLENIDIKCPKCKKIYSSNNPKCPICNKPGKKDIVKIDTFSKEVPTALQIGSYLMNKLNKIRGIHAEIIDSVVNEVEVRCLRLFTRKFRKVKAEKMFYFNNENDLAEMVKIRDDVLSDYLSIIKNAPSHIDKLEFLISETYRNNNYDKLTNLWLTSPPNLHILPKSFGGGIFSVIIPLIIAALL